MYYNISEKKKYINIQLLYNATIIMHDNDDLAKIQLTLTYQ